MLNGNAKAPLPNVRLLSNLLFREPTKPLTEVVALTSNWAFFIYTDLVHIGSSQLSVGMIIIYIKIISYFFLANKQYSIPCCSERSHPECFPIQLSSDDPKFRGFINCIEYARTVAAPRSADCALGQREQTNQATSFLDGSTIYGSTEERMKKLRSFHNGKIFKIIHLIA